MEKILTMEKINYVFTCPLHLLNTLIPHQGSPSCLLTIHYALKTALNTLVFIPMCCCLKLNKHNDHQGTTSLNTVTSYILFSLSWHDSPLVGLGLLLIHEDFCGF